MLRVLFAVVSLDLFLGGGGRLLEFGPFTLRMALFGLALAVSVVVLVARPGGLAAMDAPERIALGLVAAFVATHAGPIAIGAFSGHDPVDIATDIKPLVFVAIAPFFAICLKTPADVRDAARLAMLAGLILAAAYLAIWAGLTTRLLDFGVVYPLLNDTGEFFFRGESFFFYKGFLYLGVSLVFLLAERRPIALALALLVTVALVLTLTRGFLVSTSIAVMVLLGLRDRRVLVAALPMILVAAFIVLVWLPTMDEGYLAQRETSNAIRQGDWSFFLDNATPATLLVGQGFGAEFNGRQLFENTMLWLVWKAGLPGLAFWLAPFVLATWWFAVAFRSPEHGLGAAAWWCCVLLVYVQTMTNPFLNNPIGMSIVLMAVFSLRALAVHAVLSESPARARPPGRPLEWNRV
jgi:hypothetical protein